MIQINEYIIHTNRIDVAGSVAVLAAHQRKRDPKRASGYCSVKGTRIKWELRTQP